MVYYPCCCRTCPEPDSPERDLLVSGVIDKACAGAADDRYNGTFTALRTPLQMGMGVDNPRSPAVAFDDPSISGNWMCQYVLNTYGDSEIMPTWPGYLRVVGFGAGCYRGSNSPFAFTIRVDTSGYYWVHVNCEYQDIWGEVFYRWAFKSDQKSTAVSPITFTYQHLWVQLGTGAAPSDPGLAAMPIDASGATIEIQY